jgi:Methylase involved in ubiquinone/menaquinone biosynthesis
VFSFYNISNFLRKVGGAEGYKAALARSIFNVKVTSCDLSNEASKLAKEIFDVEGQPVNMHQLPYGDNEFDVVLCSEVLEHVTDYKKAAFELLRVAKKAVPITVPHDSKEFVENNIKNKFPHAHIHCLNLDSFNFMLVSSKKK